MNDTLSYAPTVDPEAVPQGTDLEREVAARLRPLLTLPAEALLERLLGEGLDDPDGSEPWVGYASPPSLS